MEPRSRAGGAVAAGGCSFAAEQSTIGAVEGPRNEAELMDRARGLGGRTVVELARALEVPLPANPRRAKGFVGQLVERALGASAGSRAEPDFPALGVELKTLPVNRAGRVRESTFVCTAPLTRAGESEWQSSRVRSKLARVLWVPVEADPRVAPAHRRVGAAFLWSPSAEQEAVLEADWLELTGRIGAGQVEALDARRGQALQLRPKGADATARTRAFDADGAPFMAPVRAFYLRARFTRAILAREGLVEPRER